MHTSVKSKTLTVYVSRDADALYAWISERDHLPRWHGAAWGALSRHGTVECRFVRSDPSRVIDIYWKTPAGVECLEAIRILSVGTGAEVVLTLVQPEALTDHDFQQHVRWAEKAIQELKRSPAPSSARQSVEAAKESNEKELEPVTADTVTSAIDPIATEIPPIVPGHKRLYIGNLPFDWTDEKLREHFATVGAVILAEIARFGRGGRSRGFGFVEMSTETECQSAISTFHGNLADGRKIVVRLSRLKESKPDPVPSAESSAPQASKPPRPAAEPTEKSPAAPAKGFRSRLRELGSRLTRRQEREKQAGVIATGEYEFFPRGQKVSSDPAPIEEESGNRRHAIEPSPYMEDTGDVENRGSRPPRRRPPHRRTRRTPPSRA